MKTLLLLLAFPLTAAADPCEPLTSIRNRVNYCDENSAYVAPARKCRDSFKADAKKKTEAVKKTMAANAAAATSSQAGSLANGQDDLAAAEKTIDELIQEGQAVYGDVDDYQEDFVLPVYAGHEDEFKLDPHDSKVQKEFRTHECYGEAMEDLDQVRTEVMAVLEDLGKTKEECRRMRGLVNSDEGALGSESKEAGHKKNGASAPKQTPAGKAHSDSSTITGVEESKRKDEKKK